MTKSRHPPSRPLRKKPALPWARLESGPSNDEKVTLKVPRRRGLPKVHPPPLRLPQIVLQVPKEATTKPDVGALVTCPACQDIRTYSAECRACNGVGRVSRAQAEEIRISLGKALK